MGDILFDKARESRRADRFHGPTPTARDDQTGQ
jgi:hypothetical protein